MAQIDQQANAISRTELEQARSLFQTDQQALALAKIERDRLSSTREVRLKQSSRRVDAAKQEIVRLEDLKSKYSIRAPFDGFVVNKMTEVGAWLATGDPVMEIVGLDEVDFAFNVPQEFVGKIQEAMARSGDDRAVSIQIDGLEKSIHGILLTVVPKVDLRSRLVTVRARLTNPVVGEVPLLKPGMLGRASLPVGRQREMTVLSRDALVLGGPRPLVYKLTGGEKEPKVVAVAVELGSSVGPWIEVNGDVGEGDRVVVEGNERLTQGTVVTIKSSRTDSPVAK
jgi:RND family efflux transporter MFP subunit